MKDNIPQFDKIVPIIRCLRRRLVNGSTIGVELAVKTARWAFAAYPGLPPLAKTGVHIAACSLFLWVVVGSGQPSPTSKAAAVGSPMNEPVAKADDAGSARELLIEAQRRQEVEMAEAQRMHAEQQRRLAVEQAATNREREAYLEQARYLQQLEMQQHQAAQRYHHEAQQNAGEQANREMQRYHRQMNGRPGF